MLNRTVLDAEQMQLLRDQAIVLKTTPFEERHKIVTALTENHGQITAMAKNCISSRRFGGALDHFCASEWIFTQKSGSDLFFLQEAHARRTFEGLRNDFEKLALASVFNEILLRVAPKNEVCTDLFRLHANALAAIEEKVVLSSALSDKKWQIRTLNGYLAKILQWSGSQPQLQACLGCQSGIESLDPQQTVNCSVSEAGWICEDCRTQHHFHVLRSQEGSSLKNSLLRVNLGAIQDLLTSLGLPIRQVGEQLQAETQPHQELFQFLESLLVFHIPGFDRTPLKGLRFLGLESTVLPQPESSQQNRNHQSSVFFQNELHRRS